MFGQMTAGSWIYIGTQGILQGTYQTFAAAGEKHFGSPDLSGRPSSPPGSAGWGAQPLAATMTGAAILCIEVDPRGSSAGSRPAISTRRPSRWTMRWREFVVPPRTAGPVGRAARQRGRDRPELAARGEHFDFVTDQTAAHDPLNGYVPAGLSVEEADRLRADDPDEYLRRASESIARHVEGMLEYVRIGSYVFDYGNNLRGEAQEAGVTEAFSYPGFVPAYIRPLFCRGIGPSAGLRCRAIRGHRSDRRGAAGSLPGRPPPSAVARSRSGARRVPGPAGEDLLARLRRSRKAGLAINDLVRSGQVSAPVVIGRDHLDSGSVASPYRETEAMADGSDAIADWPILNAL